MATKVHTHISTKVYSLVGMADRRLPKLHYRPADGMLNCKGPLSDRIAPNIVAEMNK